MLVLRRLAAYMVLAEVILGRCVPALQSQDEDVMMDPEFGQYVVFIEHQL